MVPIKLLGFGVNPLLDFKINNDKLIVNTINPHCYCVTKKDYFYKKSLQNADILLPDGIGIIWAMKILKGKKFKRITGADLHYYLLNQLNQTKGKVFYMGASPTTLLKIEERLKEEYPNISVASYSPPYKDTFTSEENAQIINTINVFKPDVVFVGMTAPKQEKWSFANKESLDAKIIASIGAVFDFYAGTITRPGLFWQKMGLEWLPRLFREPKRLWRRNFVSTPLFLWDIFKAKMGWLK